MTIGDVNSISNAIGLWKEKKLKKPKLSNVYMHKDKKCSYSITHLELRLRHGYTYYVTLVR